ncbi:hypothetical protein SEEGA711_28350 [Salmonella enterica subsp. enterica serovar Gaminara str. ATCC BAA-711]|nr:hypothetical protein SEEGA711_28350 [Salmonella enterica subsp. enterica serovar Gaminara str. ATCC BAA-711]
MPALFWLITMFKIISIIVMFFYQEYLWQTAYFYHHQSR